MKIWFLSALAGLAIATPASAVTVLMTPDETCHDAYVARGTYLDTGVYLARFAFDRPVVAGHLTFIHGRTFDFWGIEDGEHYGGNDIPLFRDEEFDGQFFAKIIRIERPYLRHHHWSGIGAIEEYGYYYLEATLGDFVFANAEPVRLDYSFQRLSAVPEPSSWATLIAGFGLAGWSLRRRRARWALPQSSIFAKLLFARRSGGETALICRGTASGLEAAAGIVAIGNGRAHRYIQQLSQPVGA